MAFHGVRPPEEPLKHSWAPVLSFVICLCGPATAAELPLTAHLIFDIGREHGCSRSFENTSFSGLLTLDVGADGAAELSLETHKLIIFGPSLGSYKQGERDFSERREKQRQRWRGQAVLSGESLMVQMKVVETSRTQQPRYGDLPYPEATTAVSNLRLDCKRTEVDAYPPPEREFTELLIEGLETVATEAWDCATSDPIMEPYPEVLANGDVRLAEGYGLISASDEMRGGFESSALRQADARALRSVFSYPPPPALTYPEANEHGCNLIAAVPAEGGEVRTLTGDSAFLGRIVADETHLYWDGRISFSSISAVRMEGLTMENRWDLTKKIDWVGGRIRHMELAGDQLVVATEEMLAVIPTDGSPAKTLHTDSDLFQVGVGDGMAIWAQPAHSGRSKSDVMAISLGGGNPRVLARDELRPGAAAIDGDGAYWLSWGEGTMGEHGAVRMLTSGGTEPVTLATEQPLPQMITTDEHNVYWVVITDEGRAVRKVNKAGGPVMELGRSYGSRGHRSNLEQIVVDDRYVYWNGASAILRAPILGGPVRALVTVDREGADIASFDVVNGLVVFTARFYDPDPPEKLRD